MNEAEKVLLEPTSSAIRVPAEEKIAILEALVKAQQAHIADLRSTIHLLRGRKE